MEEMEKNLETSTRLLPLLKNQFVECQDSLTMVMEIGTRQSLACTLGREGHPDG
jgi:hypothetical protein